MTKVKYHLHCAGLSMLSLCFMLPLLSCTEKQGMQDAQVTNQPPVLPALEQLIGPNLLDRQGASYSTDGLQGRLIGLYFAAQWDPPSCYFTPRLIDFYERMKAENKPFEVVLISEDRSSGDMMIHMDELKMPWLALPFVDGSHQLRLKQLYGVLNLPVLIVLDDSGQIITTDGRADVMRKKEKAYEVWR